MTIKKIALLVAVLLAMLLLSGCFGLDIRSDVDYPAGLFKKTMGKIEQIHAKDPKRKGTVSSLNLLVYLGEDRRLVSLSIPKAMTKVISEWEEELGNDRNFKKYSKDVDFDLEKLEDLDALGPGLLIEIEIEDKEKLHALIWLE
jgi:hypothetical protein